MKKVLMFSLFFVLVLGMISAQETNSDSFDLEQFNCQLLKSANANLSNVEIPSFVPYSDEVFNIYVGDKFFVGVSLEEKKLTEIFCEEKEERTYDVKLQSFQVITDIANAENPLDALKTKQSSGEIEIKGVTFGKKFKQFFINLGIKFASWFN